MANAPHAQQSETTLDQGSVASFGRYENHALMFLGSKIRSERDTNVVLQLIGKVDPSSQAQTTTGNKRNSGLWHVQSSWCRIFH
jgi:hypothetical protein